MKYNLNKAPKIKNAEGVDQPYAINYKMSIFLAECLESRISRENPALEYRISQELRNTNDVELTVDEKEYLLPLIVALDIDNLFKGQILGCFN